jgi:hypothetical protein
VTVRRLAAMLCLVVGLLLVTPAASALDLPGIDCTEAPAPDVPGQGLAGFFDTAPDDPPTGDPFVNGATTTPYEHYGFAGLRWNTYDLGCGPDAASHPDAVIGTAVANWLMNLPVAFASLTSSLTAAAYQPTFLGVFDPLLTRVSTALHHSLFRPWLPVVLAVTGLLMLLRARRMPLATTTGAVGWALLVIAVAAALFRWPVHAGHLADDTVTTSLGTVVDALQPGEAQDPAVSVASHVQSSILYTSWLAGQLGSATSPTAEKYGADLFDAQTLTWDEAQTLRDDPDAAARIIEDKQAAYTQIADAIRSDDPAAYQHLTGKRSDTRVAYAFLATLATFLALPFLLMSALLLLGSYLIVRLAVMLFPAFAILGLFPSARGIVLGVGRTVGAALINAVVFGVGSAVTIVVLGAILDPATGLPLWLRLVLLPLFSLIMWSALKPFRRLTSMAGLSGNPFGQGAEALSTSADQATRLTKKAAAGAASAYTGGAAAGTAAAKALDGDDRPQPPERAEARPTSHPVPTPDPIPAPALTAAVTPAVAAVAFGAPATTGVGRGFGVVPPDPPEPGGMREPPAESIPLAPTEPEWFDGEEVYTLYRPADDPDVLL